MKKNMKLRSLLFIALKLALPTSALAFSNAENKADILGLGLTSCADFAKYYQKNPAQVESAFFDWFAGFATGANGAMDVMGHPEQKKNLHMRPADTKRFLRVYCDQHPLATYLQASIDVMLSLPDLIEQPTQEPLK